MKKNNLITLFILCGFACAAQWNTSSTNIYNSNSGNVGIGTAAPAYKLDVVGPANDWKAKFQGPDGYIAIGPANSSWAHIYTDRPAFLFNAPVYTYYGFFSSYSSADLSLQTNGTTRLSILNSNGSVGVGTTSPEGKLTITQVGNGWNDGLRINRDANNYLTLTEDVTDIRLKNWGTGAILFFNAAGEAVLAPYKLDRISVLVV
jgi:hypothetical protein